MKKHVTITTPESIRELQKKHHRQLSEKREALKKRKERTRRLIIRGAIAEKLIPNAAELSDEEFQRQLYEALGRAHSITPTGCDV